MKFVTGEKDETVFIGIMTEDESSVIDLGKGRQEQIGINDLPLSMIECISLGDEFVEKVQSLLEWLQDHPASARGVMHLRAEIVLHAPIPRPSKNIFCVGKNYAEHAIEMGSKEDIPEHVMIFTKAPTTVIGPNQQVSHHLRVTEQLDYEGELAVIIGKKGKEISKENALDYVFGYTIINDITARDLQAKHKQFFIGKSLDTTCPMGPWIVHKSQIPNPNYLHIQTKVNGEVRQNSTTAHFIFSIEEVISVLSQGMTLEPGDIVATGTPAGVGKGFNPPRFLKPEDQIEISIEGIGTLMNTLES
ncbi:fumarylacetoacetate hydrolase family protein [Cytobacillus spongiae]|uniref:fumarylacetoacetate hydrolase family protein n=1 Tax=Cytobacillus spongiae TaxID=2901381 RepID=UPI001F41CC4D|nr:fumarylacetoacetate hydrolase family protein [Cytobacillus spongiae]UII56949.1 fumarylacetoacetate hydrolase family protein [Cytobacillus spongiae]